MSCSQKTWFWKNSNNLSQAELFNQKLEPVSEPSLGSGGTLENTINDYQYFFSICSDENIEETAGQVNNDAVANSSSEASSDGPWSNDNAGQI